MTDSETTTIIPAEPGYQVIELMEGGGLFKTPIIAWRIDVCVDRDMTFVYTKPVTIESDEEDAGRPVLAPDGRVHWGDSVFIKAFPAVALRVTRREREGRVSTGQGLRDSATPPWHTLREVPRVTQAASLRAAIVNCGGAWRKLVPAFCEIEYSPLAQG